MVFLRKLDAHVWVEFLKNGLSEDIVKFYSDPQNQETYRFEVFQTDSSFFVRLLVLECTNQTFSFMIHNCGWFNLPYRLYKGWFDIDSFPDEYFEVNTFKICLAPMSIGQVIQFRGNLYNLHKQTRESYSGIETFIFKPYPKES